MTINEYQQLALRTLNRDLPRDEVLLNAAMGLCGESGEAIDLLKKHRMHGHAFDREKFAKELGDIAWYLAEAAYAIDMDLETIFQMNIDKLKQRYPEGFDAQRSISRTE